jgi:RimJ/RimL family protein N-acetyltransferase
LLELAKDEICKINGLLEPFAHQLVVPAMLAGRAPARCWVDALDAPSIAVAWDLVNGLVFCAGAPEVDDTAKRLGSFLRSELLPLAHSKGYAFLYIEFSPASLLEQVERGLADREVSRESLLFYALAPEDTAPDLPAPALAKEGLARVRLKPNLLSSELTNMDELRMCIDACWRDRARYFQEGIGYAAVHGDIVASWCSTDYVLGGQADLYVETFAGYKGRGLATWVAAGCVEACRSKGWTTHWHCWSNNAGSRRVAEKVGLRLVQETPILSLGTQGGASTSQDLRAG